MITYKTHSLDCESNVLRYLMQGSIYGSNAY